MSDPYFQRLFAQRIGGASYGKGTDIYKFEKIKRAKRQALADHPDRRLVDFGIGENDEMAPESVRQAMGREINRPENRGYADNGIGEFKEAVARFMQRQFQVELDPTREINHCIGSKTALAMIPATLIDPGDVTLMTVPGYPVAGTHTRHYGGEVHKLPLRAENGFLPDFDAIPADVLRRAKLLVLNYPNSPTGRVATREFYAQVVELAKQNELVVVQDAAHMMLSYETPPLSFLQVPGARDVGVEVHSMSKGWHMIGWRLGWVCGHERLVRAFADVKDNSDSGQFMAIQKAAAAALDDDDIPCRAREKYLRRLGKLVDALRECGFECHMPGGTYFLYVPSPKGIEGGPVFDTAEAASQYLITRHSICTVPWDDAGAFLRFSVTYEAADEAAEDALMAEMQKRLNSIPFVFSQFFREVAMPRRSTVFVPVLLLLSGAFVVPSGCGSGDAPKAQLSYKEMVAQAQRLSSPEARTRQLAQIGRQQTEAGDRFGAEQTFELAAKASQKIEDADARIRATVYLAEQLAPAGKQMEAAELLKPLATLVEQIDSAEVRAGDLAAIAGAQAAAGRMRAAKESTATAEALVEKVPDVIGQVLVLGHVAKAYQRMDRADDVQRVMDDALARARAAEEDRARADCIALAGFQFHELGDREMAQKILDEAAAASRKIENPHSKAHAMYNVATKLVDTGHSKKAYALLKEAEAVAESIPDRDLQTQTAEKVRTLMFKLSK